MFYDVDAVIIAAGITTGIVLGLTIFAFQVNIISVTSGLVSVSYF